MKPFIIPADFNTTDEKTLFFFRKKKDGTLACDENGITASWNGNSVHYTENDFYSYSYHKLEDGDGRFLTLRLTENSDFCNIYGEENAIQILAYLSKINAEFWGRDIMKKECFGNIRDRVLARLREYAAEDDLRIGLPADDLKLSDIDPDTLRWILAANAIYAETNPMDWRKFGGYDEDDIVGRYRVFLHLKDGWDVTDREGTLKLLHRLTDAHIVWDLTRAVQIAGFGYLCRFLTLREAMDACIEACRRMQKATRSWPKMGAAYLRSYEAMFPVESTNYKRRAEAYKRLCEDPEGPYNVDYDLELKKTW